MPRQPIDIPPDFLFDYKGSGGMSPYKESSPDDIFAEKSRKAWHADAAPEPRCDFSPNRIAINLRHPGFRTITPYRRSLYGRTLSDIKEDPNMVPFLANSLYELISSIIGTMIRPDQFAVVAPPKRRHKVNNFAAAMAGILAGRLGIPFIDDFAECHSRQRVNAKFTLAAPVPEQHNIIVVDDIITTGSTLISMHSLLRSLDKNSLFFAAINNKL